MKAMWKLFVCLVLLAMIAGSLGFFHSQAQAGIVIPTITILSVSQDDSVTIRTANFPANETFNVLMGKIGTRGIGGTKVASVNSGSGGSFEATFNIPDALKGSYQIAIRLESPSSGYYSYNWFFNNTTGASQPGTPPTYTPLPSGVYPTFLITAVDRDKNVSIRAYNLPAKDEYVVRMGAMGTRGINGIQVTKIASEQGGTQDFEFEIPAELYGFYQISIRLESTESGYYSFNWFYNNTTGEPAEDTGSTVSPLPPSVIPTFSIIKVEKNTSVTIKTANFPAADTFNVFMGSMGTRGVNGTKVAAINSGSGGILELTFTIPELFKNSYQIAVRLESPNSGYYSYNWFYNSTYP